MLKVLCNIILLGIFYTTPLDDLPIMRGVGGDFRAESSLGHEVSLSDYKDNIVLLTFGFTNCPDVCPVTLGYLHFIYSKLTAEQKKKVKILFITVDSEHDTPDHMREYLATFNKEFIGISPDKENLAEIAKKFGVTYAEVGIELPTYYNRPLVKLDKDNTAKVFNHSVSIFLLDKRNQTRGIFYSGSDSDYISSEIGNLLLEDGPSISKAKENNIITENFWIRLNSSASKVTAIYGKIENNSDKTIHLIGISCKNIAERAELHLTKIINHQVEMIPQVKLSIPPNSTFVMKPMHYHIMLRGLKRNLIENEEVKFNLEFSNNTNKTVNAIVKKNDIAHHQH